MDKNNLSEKVHALFSLKVKGFSESLERPGIHYFCEENQLLDSGKVADLSQEFERLIVDLLGSQDPTDMTSEEFFALIHFFNHLSKRILMCGGHVEDVVRYTQALQMRLIEVLEEISGIEFSQSRSVLLYFNGIFNELIMAVFRAYYEEREQTLQAQQAEIRETATPISEIWDGVLTLPVIGTLDSERTLLVMETLLTRVAKDHARFVVMDLTGVKSVDSQVSHHIIQVVQAVKLMGAEAIITGIHPDIARSLVNLNIDFSHIKTRASISDGLKEVFRVMSVTVNQNNH